MTAASDITTRVATPDDAPALRAAFGDRPVFRRLFEADATLLIVLAERRGAVAAALSVELLGHPVESGWAWTPGPMMTDRADPDALLPVLCDAAVGALRATPDPPAALAAPIEVGDRAASRRLEAAGFRPRGGAYRTIGPGVVEYLDGYADPHGFQVEFVREVGAR